MPHDAASAVPARILPNRTEHNAAFWTGGARGHLMIGRCGHCRAWVHPPAADCPDCGGVLAAEPVSGTGTVLTYTVNHQPFNPSVPVPYVIAIVELDEQPGLLLAANIVDCAPEDVRIGLPVQVRFERQDPDPADGPVFVPVFAPRA